VRVLVTGGEHVGPLAAVRALRRAGHEPWALVPHKGAYAARSRAVEGVVVAPDPGAEPSRFVEAVADACRRIRPDVVLPGTEPALTLLSRHAGGYGAAVVGAPDAALVDRATDKSALSGLAETVGLSPPPTRRVDRNEAEEAAEELGYPVIVKPERSDVGEGGSDTLTHGTPQRAADARTLEAVVRLLPGEHLLVQPYLEGRLAAVCGVAWNGRIVCASHQVARRIWPVDVGISAYAETVARDTTLEAAVGRLMDALAWSGIFQVQFLEARGAHYLIDVNPRIYGSLALAVAAGLNLPSVWVALLAGESPSPGPYRVGVRYRSEERDIQAIAHALRHGPRLAGLVGLVPRPHTTHAVLCANDPAPALASLAKLRR
jgi:biotin carboxylase